MTINDLKKKVYLILCQMDLMSTIMKMKVQFVRWTLLRKIGMQLEKLGKCKLYLEIQKNLLPRFMSVSLKRIESLNRLSSFSKSTKRRQQNAKTIRRVRGFM